MDAELIRLSEQLAKTVGGAIAAKALLERLLGPSFEYAGRSMAALLERYGNRNLNDVFRRAARKLAASDEPIRSVNPRVLRAVIEDASYTKDDVTAEYFAGLLASSAHGDSEDDRAMTFLSIVRSLTSSQIRFHRVAYSFFRVKYMSHEASLSDSASLPRLFFLTTSCRNTDFWRHRQDDPRPSRGSLGKRYSAGTLNCFDMLSFHELVMVWRES